MMIRTLPWALFAAGGLLLVDATPALAATADLERACPDIALTLQEELQPVVRQLDRPGRVEVSFRVENERVTAVDVRGAPRRYLNPVRRALGVVRCSPAAGGHYTVNIELRNI
jgi:hypothetical protein